MTTKISSSGTVYSSLFSQMSDTVRFKLNSIEAPELDESGDYGKVSIFPGKIRAYQFVEIDDTSSSVTRNVVFRINTATSQSINKSVSGVVNVADIAPSDTSWVNHNFLGWSTTEYPSYSSIQSGSAFVTSIDTSTTDELDLYAVYSTNFQGLIDEGFAVVQTDLTYYNGSQPVRVSSNHYPKELVTDFEDVFLSRSGSLISNAGVVGEGTRPNSFIFDNSNYWLSNEEWYNLYNGTTMPHQPENNEFRNLNFSAYDTVEFKFEGPNRPGGGAGGSYRAFNFGARAPRHLIIDVGSKQWQGFDKVVGYTSTAWAAQMEEITLKANNGQSAKPTSLNAAFEECRRLKTINGLDISGTSMLTYLFHNCIALATASASLTSTGRTVANAQTSYMFAGCTSLKTIEFIVDVSQASKSTFAAFAGCSNLESLQLYGINAALNQTPDTSSSWRYTWDFTDTKLNQTSIDYMIANLVECDTTVDGFTRKSIGFPASATLSAAQIARLQDNGWDVYVGGSQI